MMILGGVQTPFVVSASVSTDNGRELTFTGSFDTFMEAQEALEDFILDHDDHAHDYVIDIDRVDLRAGSIVRFDFVTVTDPTRPDRKPHTRSKRVGVGAWAICWKKPMPLPEDPEETVARKELRELLLADGIRRI